MEVTLPDSKNPTETQRHNGTGLSLIEDEDLLDIVQAGAQRISGSVGKCGKETDTSAGGGVAGLLANTRAKTTRR